MSKTLLLGAVVLAFTAASASAQPGYDYGRSAGSEYGYGVQAPLYDYGAGAYGHRAPSYVEHSPIRPTPIKHRHVYH